MSQATKKTRFEIGPISKATKFVFGVFGFGAVYKPPAPFPMNVAISAFFGGLSLATGGAGKLNLKRHQKYRDQRAENILQDIRSSKKPATFSFYLRSFDTTGKLLEILERKSVMPFQYDDTDLETFIACAVEPFASLLALGMKGEQIGAGRIESDENSWERTMELLAKKAKFLFVIPYDSDGAKTELKFIRNNNLLKKTIFIMPPQAVKQLNWAEQWKRATKGVEEYDYKLPSYNPNGMIFYMINGKTIKYQENFIVEKNFRKMSDKIESFCKKAINL
ncbi:MAG: hypothetical protein GY850_02260 [bacterium]|nr:hypothetical protein [bacterium]